MKLFFLASSAFCFNETIIRSYVEIFLHLDTISAQDWSASITRILHACSDPFRFKNQHFESVQALPLLLFFRLLLMKVWRLHLQLTKSSSAPVFSSQDVRPSPALRERSLPASFHEACCSSFFSARRPKESSSCGLLFVREPSLAVTLERTPSSFVALGAGLSRISRSPATGLNDSGPYMGTLKGTLARPNRRGATIPSPAPQCLCPERYEGKEGDHLRLQARDGSCLLIPIRTVHTAASASPRRSNKPQSFNRPPRLLPKHLQWLQTLYLRLVTLMGDEATELTWSCWDTYFMYLFTLVSIDSKLKRFSGNHLISSSCLLLLFLPPEILNLYHFSALCSVFLQPLSNIAKEI